MIFVQGMGVCATGVVESVPGRAYFETVRNELDRASSSIVVCLYSFTFRPQLSDSPVFALAQSLKKAHDRGVHVEVLLDQNIDFIEEGDGGFMEGKNVPAYSFFREQGISVFYDDPTTYTHAKCVVIDGETVILGSSNWTDSALNRNFETNVLVRSKALARDILAEIRAVPRQEPIPTYDDDFISVPLEFLQNPRFFGRMVNRKDDRAFDVYLHLVAKAQQKGEPSLPLVLSHEELAVAMGLETADRESYRRQVNRMLAKLEKLYGLIEVQSEFNNDSVVTLRDLTIDTHFSGGESSGKSEAGFRPEARRNDEKSLERIDGERKMGGAEGEKAGAGWGGVGGAWGDPEKVLRVPSRYWSLGWDRRLTFSEKGFFLVSLYESSVSTRRPRWSAAQKTLARRYGPSPWFFGEGAMGLRRRNLLEVDWAPYTGGPFPREATVYTPNILYDPVELEKKMAEIKSKHDPEQFERAMKAAQTVYEDSDVNGIVVLISLEKQYGRERVEAAVKIIQQKNPDSPLRTLAYLIGTIRNLK
ncbi:MAG: hypothetical protein IPN19_07800 [Elusimicrobia bacterium]|nr:hypothetical protein [Elusimicrobiota bacterium]